MVRVLKSGLLIAALLAFPFVVTNPYYLHLATVIAIYSILVLGLDIVFGAILLMLAIELFNRRSVFGKAVVATAADRDAAGLMGINTALVITFSYALSSMRRRSRAYWWRR